MAKKFLQSTLDEIEFNKIITCKSANEIWDKSKVTYEEFSQVKESNIYIIVYEYKMFKMSNDESIFTMRTRFINIINSLTIFGNAYSNLDIARKIINFIFKL